VGNLQILRNPIVKASENIGVNKIEYDKVTEKYTLKLSKTLSKDTVVDIFFDYVGNLSDNMIGFYRSSYVDEKGQIK